MPMSGQSVSEIAGNVCSRFGTVRWRVPALHRIEALWLVAAEALELYMPWTCLISSNIIPLKLYHNHICMILSPEEFLDYSSL